MEPEKIQSDIDALLTYMNDTMESVGGTIKECSFKFEEGDADRVQIDKLHNWPKEHLTRIINICKSRSLITNVYINSATVKLTEEGQSRALSVKHGKDRSYELSGSSYTIGSVHFAGPGQIGDGNTQNITNFFKEMIDKIEQSEASPEEKEEVKSRLARFLEHPLTNTVVGGVAGSITALL